MNLLCWGSFLPQAAPPTARLHANVLAPGLSRRGWGGSAGGRAQRQEPLAGAPCLAQSTHAYTQAQDTASLPRTCGTGKLTSQPCTPRTFPAWVSRELRPPRGTQNSGHRWWLPEVSSGGTSPQISGDLSSCLPSPLSSLPLSPPLPALAPKRSTSSAMTHKRPHSAAITHPSKNKTRTLRQQLEHRLHTEPWGEGGVAEAPR